MSPAPTLLFFDEERLLLCVCLVCMDVCLPLYVGGQRMITHGELVLSFYFHMGPGIDHVVGFS